MNEITPCRTPQRNHEIGTGVASDVNGYAHVHSKRVAFRLARETQTPWSSKLSRPFRGIADSTFARLRGRRGMSCSENRSRPIRKEVTFTEDEWKRTQRLYKELTRYAPQHRSFASYARRMLSERRDPRARNQAADRPRAARKGDWPNRRERQLDSPLGEPKRAHHAGASGGGHRGIPPRRGAAGKAVRGQAGGQGTAGQRKRGLRAELSDLVLSPTRTVHK